MQPAFDETKEVFNICLALNHLEAMLQTNRIDHNWPITSNISDGWPLGEYVPCKQLRCSGGLKLWAAVCHDESCPVGLDAKNRCTRPTFWTQHLAKKCDQTWFILVYTVDYRWNPAQVAKICWCLMVMFISEVHDTWHLPEDSILVLFITSCFRLIAGKLRSRIALRPLVMSCVPGRWRKLPHINIQYKYDTIQYSILYKYMKYKYMIYVKNEINK